MAPIHLEYELSPEQKELSNKLVENYKKGIDSLVFAVCGSGKTEITLELIKTVVEQGGTVGFAIPRKDVVIEIQERLKDIFQTLKVISVYGGHTEELKGDIICLTTHQIYRYKNYFDLLILDETDAFPFKENDVLNMLFFNSIKGHYIQMSATPPTKIINFFKEEGRDILHLDVRYHHHFLPVPKIDIQRSFLKYLVLIKYLKKFEKEGKPVFLFCPTIEMCENVFSFVRIFIKEVNNVHSKKADRNEIISSFKNGLIQTLITTSVLERGVTVKDLQVLIFKAHHPLYDSGTLIQISGRVGRKIGAEKGEIIFICDYETNEIKKCIREIQSSNQVLQDMLQKDSR